MKTWIIVTLTLVVSALTAGCSVNEPIYAPFSGRFGYSEAEIEPDVWDVTFVTRPDVSPGQGVELAKTRAAELAWLRGRRYVLIDDVARDTSVEERRLPPRRRTVWLHDATGASRPVTVWEDEGVSRLAPRPTTTLRVRLLDDPDPRAFEAVDILRAAAARGWVDGYRGIGSEERPADVEARSGVVGIPRAAGDDADSGADPQDAAVDEHPMDVPDAAGSVGREADAPE